MKKLLLPIIVAIVLTYTLSIACDTKSFTVGAGTILGAEVLWGYNLPSTSMGSVDTEPVAIKIISKEFVNNAVPGDKKGCILLGQAFINQGGRVDIKDAHLSCVGSDENGNNAYETSQPFPLHLLSPKDNKIGIEVETTTKEDTTEKRHLRMQVKMLLKNAQDDSVKLLYIKVLHDLDVSFKEFLPKTPLLLLIDNSVALSPKYIGSFGGLSD